MPGGHRRPPDPAGSAVRAGRCRTFDRLKTRLGDPHADRACAACGRRRAACGRAQTRSWASGTRRTRRRRRAGRWSRPPALTRRATAASSADRRARSPAPGARAGTLRHSRHDSTAAEPLAPQRCAPSERGTRRAPSPAREPSARRSAAAATAITAGRRKSANRPGGGGGFRARIDRVERGHEIGDRRESIARGFRQAPAHDLRQRRRDLRIQRPTDRAGCHGQDGVQGPERAVALERPDGPRASRRARRRARRCRRVDRRARRAPAPAPCTRRCRRRATRGEPDCRRRRAASCSVARPKSRIFTRPSPREEDVLGLQVAMDDAAFVRGAKPSGHLERDVERRVHGERAGAKPRAQRLAFQTLGHEVRGAAVIRRRRRPSARWCD